MNRLGLVGVLLIALLMVLLLLPAHAAPRSITQVQSGLLAQDSLTTGNTAYWTLNGDATLTGAPHTYSEDSQGMHLGIQSTSAGSWIGFYAESPNTAGYLFHAVLTLPYSSIPSNEFNTGLYVQTSTDRINYVTCAGQAESTGYSWSVVYTRGNAQSAQQYFTVYTQVGGPLTRDCTIITNGSNQMQVYLDGQLVYSSSSLDLQMPSPFNSYLEVQTTYAGGMLYAKYNDYYATVGNLVQVQNAPAGDTAQIVDSQSKVLASAIVDSGGAALLDVGQYHLPITGYVQVYDTAHNLVATTGGTAAIWGGDVYQVSNTTTTTTSVTSSISTTVSSTTTTSTTTTTTSSTRTSTTTTAVALNGVQSTSGTVSSAPYQLTIANFNAAAGSNRLLVVGVEANNNNVASVTFGGLQLILTAGSFNNNDAEFWYLTNPSGTGDIVVTMNGPTSVVVGAYSFSGVDQTIPIPTTFTNFNTAAGSPAISITTQYPNSWVLDSPSIFGGSTLGSPSCTQGWNVNVPNAITGASSSTAVPSPRTVTCSWTASSGDLWDNVAIEIKASA